MGSWVDGAGLCDRKDELLMLALDETSEDGVHDVMTSTLRTNGHIRPTGWFIVNIRLDDSVQNYLSHANHLVPLLVVSVLRSNISSTFSLTPIFASV